MTHEMVTCRPDDDVRLAERHMSKHQKARIVCADVAGVPAGIISFADLSRLAEPGGTIETLKKVKAEEP